MRGASDFGRSLSGKVLNSRLGTRAFVTGVAARQGVAPCFHEKASRCQVLGIIFCKFLSYKVSFRSIWLFGL